MIKTIDLENGFSGSINNDLYYKSITRSMSPKLQSSNQEMKIKEAPTIQISLEDDIEEKDKKYKSVEYVETISDQSDQSSARSAS